MAALPLLLVYLAYLPGISGALYYDDYANLNALREITDWATASGFVFGGQAGPLGRPLSLLTFLPHATGWPQNSETILHVNVWIHLTNAALLLFLGRTVLDLYRPLNSTLNFRIALSAALLWAALPLLVSTTLIAVQRMTGLAATFTLLGLIGFVYGYRIANNRPLLGLILQLGTLGLATLLSIFSKENGALTPIFALIIDTVLLRNAQYQSPYRNALRLALAACLLALLIYLSPLARNWFVVNDYRGFSSWERLQTQFVVLWQYLFDAFIPRNTGSFGPFRDSQVIVSGSALPLFAGLSWLGALIVSFFLRRRTPWLLFAILWFLTGHLLESSTILLELVFEHRNYLAVYGFCIAISWAAWHAPQNLGRIAPALLMTYTAVLLGITFAMTSLWGDPVKAAERWAEGNPGSARAALHAAFLTYGPNTTSSSDAREELLSFQRLQFALHILDRTARACPECLSVRAQALAYACRTSTPDDVRARFDKILALGKTGEVSMPVVDVFFPLHQLVENSACDPLSFKDLLNLSEALLENPQSAPSVYKTRLHFIAAMNAQRLNDHDKVELHLAEGERTSIEARPVLQFQVHHLVEQGRFDAAQAAIDRRRNTEQLRDNTQIQDLLAELESFVEAARRHASN